MITLASFKDIHKGETIIVCGCGKSLNDFTHPEEFITIGVNDVGRKFHPNYLVVVNPPEQFKDDRFEYVRNSKAQFLFTQLDLGIRNPPIVRFKLGERGGTDFSDPDVLHYTQNSPYVALCLAVQMGAKRIGLIGVDFTEHHFFGSTGPHILNNTISQVNEEYSQIAKKLRNSGIEIINFSDESLLDCIKKEKYEVFYKRFFLNQKQSRESSEIILSKYKTSNKLQTDSYYKQKIKQFDGLNLVQIAKTNCAGSLWNLHNLLKKYTNVNSRVVTASNITNGRTYPKDLLLSEESKVYDQLTKADIIHFHNWIDKQSEEMIPYYDIIKNKPAVLQFHTEPELLRTHFNGRDPVRRNDILTLVIAQKHVRYFPNAIPVPNAIDIFNPLLKPNKNNNGESLFVLYTPTDTKNYSDKINTCRGKGYQQTIQILNSLEKEGIIKAIVETNLPWENLMKLRRESNIVIDECVTGGYHLTSLEGLSQGLLTIAYLDSATRDILCKITGSSLNKLPWLNTSIQYLKEVMLTIRNNPFILEIYSNKGRKWMERYWNPYKIIWHYLAAYQFGLVKEFNNSKKKTHNINLNDKLKSTAIKSITCTDVKLPNQPQATYETTFFQRIQGLQHPILSEDLSQIIKLRKELLSKAGYYEGRPCHILGNGPSVNQLNLSLIKSRLVIGVNASPLLHKELGRSTDFYCVTDQRFLKDDSTLNLIKLARESIRVFAGYCSGFVEDDNINYVKIRGGDGISDDIISGFYHSCSVVLFAAQLALWLGSKDIYLHGCEFDYRNGRFYKEKNIRSYDKYIYPRIEKNTECLSQWLSSKDGSLTVIGPSRLVGHFNSRSLNGIKSKTIYDFEKSLQT